MTAHRVDAVFRAETELSQAVGDLLGQGFEPRDLEVRSSAPLLENPVPGSRLRSRVPLFAILGGLLGGLAALLVAVFTAWAYPLPTGGMPIVAPPPVGIITYEGMALGAILATVGAVLIECGLLRPRSAASPMDLHLAEGRILLAICCRNGASAEKARELLRAAPGALEVKLSPGRTGRGESAGGPETT